MLEADGKASGVCLDMLDLLFIYADMFEQMNNPLIDGELHLLPFAYFKTDLNAEMVSLSLTYQA